MFHSRASRSVLGVIVVIIAGMAIGNIEVELPPELQGGHRVKGRVSSCKFGKLTKHNDKFFLGITLGTGRTPYLRMNPLIKDKHRYLELCRNSAEVVVTYEAKKRLIGPVRYWVKEIENMPSPTTGSK